MNRCHKIWNYNNMDKAKNIEDLIKEIADSISIGCCVRYDPESLEYGELHLSKLDEYGEYIDMAEFPDDVDDELLDWEIDEVMRIREICDLPDAIDPPRTGEQIDWMADFANNRSSGTKFVRDIQCAIGSRHPFGAFKDVMAHYGLLNDWYQYRDACYMDYVRRELE